MVRGFRAPWIGPRLKRPGNQEDQAHRRHLEGLDLALRIPLRGLEGLVQGLEFRVKGGFCKIQGFIGFRILGFIGFGLGVWGFRV